MIYNPQEIESKWQRVWKKKLQFRAEDFSNKKKFYALVEFPYPSGSGLHTGHAFNYTLMDIYARKKRMDGLNVLCPMGWDAFGLPTENYAIKTGIHPAEATRQNTDNFRRQMDKIGTTFNWGREINTTDPQYYKWTQWIFEQFFKHGLAYKKEMDINWCPSCKIGLANEEVINGRCERCGAQAGKRKLAQWLLKITAYADKLADELDLVDYPESVVAAQRNWIGRSEGITVKFPLKDSNEAISVFTTRLDTLFGVTFFVLAPEHPLVSKITAPERKKEVDDYAVKAQQKKEFERIDETKEKTGVFTGAYVQNPLSGEKIPVYVADFVVMTYGTGAIMGVPGHDARDWQFAKKQGVEIREVISGGDIEKEAYTGPGEMVRSQESDGLDSETGKQKVSEALQEKGMAEKSVQYHLRDWIFSRQHYWGEPIPMIYCKSCAEKGISFWDTKQGKEVQSMFEPPEGFEGWFPVPEKELPLTLPDVERYEPTGTGKSPLAAIKDWVKVECPHCASEAERETDTMPNWAGSSWYFLRYIDPENKKSLADFKKMEYWMPVDLYIGGVEHTTLHLLYSRFWHKFLNDLGLVPGKEPYQVRKNRGIILGEDGRKMSKSKGNIISVDEIIETLGADTLRTYLVFMGPYNNTMAWSTTGIQGARRFLARLYNFVLNQTEKKVTRSEKEVQSLVHCLVKEVGEDIDSLKYNTAVAKMMKFLNDAGRKDVSLDDLKKVLLVLSPFAPFLAEELWEKIGGRFSVHTHPWPGYDLDLIKKERVTLVVQVNGKVRGKIEVEPDITEKEASKRAFEQERVKKWIEGKEIKKTIFIPGRLINFVV